MTTPIDDVLEDLVAEYDRLESILESLTDEQWRSESDAPGWTVTDVMIHLAQTEEACRRHDEPTERAQSPGPRRRSRSTTGSIDKSLPNATSRPSSSRDGRLRGAHRSRRFAPLDPDARYAWAHTPLKPRTLATTRLAEHWAHALDVTVPFDIPLPDTDRLRHIAWLGHSTLPYGFAFNGQEAHEVHVELTAPDGASVWRYGPG